MEGRHREILQANLKILSADLSPEETFPHLLTKFILTTEDTEVIKHEITRRDRALKLVEILMTKGPNAFPAFIEALAESHEHLRDALQSAQSNISLQPIETSVLGCVQRELVSLYQRSVRTISPLPWSDFVQLQVCNAYIGLQRMRGLHHRKAFIDKAKTSGYDVTQLDAVFDAHEESDAPSHVCIIGGQGSGKSTACFKLVYTWAHNFLTTLNNTNNITSSNNSGNNIDPAGKHFGVVFFLKASQIEDSGNIYSAILEHLLPDDIGISSDSLKTCLEENQDEILFVIDGFDEQREPGRVGCLTKLLTRKMLAHTSILVTSRTSYLNPLLKHFDSVFNLVGLHEKRQEEFISNFATEQCIDPEQLQPLKQRLAQDQDFREVCYNPLNLTVMCLLAKEVGYSIPDNRTGLYSALLDFMLDKAAHRLSADVDDLKNTLSPLFKLSFEALKNGEFVLKEKTLRKIMSTKSVELLQNLGFLSKEMQFNRLREESQFVFTHKCFMEFCAAKYVCEMPDNQMEKVLQGIFINPDFWIVCIYVTGLVAEIDGGSQLPLVFRSWASGYFCPLDSREKKHKFFHVDHLLESHTWHSILHCLCEIDFEDLSKENLKSITDIMSSNLPLVSVLPPPFCSITCMSGLERLCQIYQMVHQGSVTNQNTLSVILSCQCMDLTGPPKFHQVVSGLPSCSPIRRVTIHSIPDVPSLVGILNALKPGSDASSIREISLLVQGISQESLAGKLDFTGFTFGKWLESLEVKGTDLEDPDLMHELVCALPVGGNIKKLRMRDCPVGVNTAKQFCTRVKSWKSLEHLAVTGHSLNIIGSEIVIDVLCILMNCVKLKVFEISYMPLKTRKDLFSLRESFDDGPSVLHHLEDVLRNRDMMVLVMRHCALDSHVLATISSIAQCSSTSLTTLKLSYGIKVDEEAMNALLSDLPNCSHLQSLGLQGTLLAETNYTTIGKILPLMKSLKSFSLDNCNSTLVSCVAEGLTAEVGLESLSISGLGCTDGCLITLAEALPKLPHLSELCMFIHQGNAVKESDLPVMFQSLSKCQNLKLLTLRHFQLSDHNMYLVCNLLKARPKIQYLGLSVNRFGPKGVSILEDCLLKQESLLLSLDLTENFVTAYDSEIGRVRKLVGYLRINWF